MDQNRRWNDLTIYDAGIADQIQRKLSCSKAIFTIFFVLSIMVNVAVVLSVVSFIDPISIVYVIINILGLFYSYNYVYHGTMRNQFAKSSFCKFFLVIYGFTSFLVFAWMMVSLLFFYSYRFHEMKEDYDEDMIIFIFALVFIMFTIPFIHSLTILSIYRKKLRIAKELNSRGPIAEPAPLNLGNQYAPPGNAVQVLQSSQDSIANPNVAENLQNQPEPVPAQRARNANPVPNSAPQPMNAEPVRRDLPGRMSDHEYINQPQRPQQLDQDNEASESLLGDENRRSSIGFKPSIQN